MNKEQTEQFHWMAMPTDAKAWAQGGGLMVWLSVAFGLVGAGGYITSVFFGSFVTLLISWLVVTVLKNFVHFLHMSKKSKVATMANNFGNAWIARGTAFTVLFSVLGLIQLIIMYFMPEVGILNMVFEVLTCLAALGIIIYEVCLLASNRAIPFWQGAMVPVTFVLWSVVCGLTLVLAFSPVAIRLDWATLVAVGALAVSIAFSIWAATKQNETSAASAKELISGSLSGMFWIAAIIIGLVGTAGVVIAVMAGAVPSMTCVVAWICAIIGTLGFTLCIFKAAKYRSLI